MTVISSFALSCVVRVIGTRVRPRAHSQLFNDGHVKATIAVDNSEMRHVCSRLVQKLPLFPIPPLTNYLLAVMYRIFDIDEIITLNGRRRLRVQLVFARIFIKRARESKYENGKL